MMNKKTTIKDIAAEAGVSIALVSFVMNNQSRNPEKTYKVSEETSRRILEIAKRLDYHPNNAARTLRQGKTNTIGVILSDISNKFFSDIARCIEDRAYKYNYTVIFGSTDENAGKLENLVKVFIDKGVDGLIIVPCVGSEKCIRQIADARIPLVLMDRHIGEEGISSVVLNNRYAVSLAVTALADSGCSKIEMIAYNMRLSNIIDREAGYRQTMKEMKLDEHTAIHRIDYRRIDEQVSEVMRSAVERGVEGFVFATNTLTIAGLKALDRLGTAVPEQMRIVGFDDNEAFELYRTSITYVSQPVEQFGSEALDLMMKHISGKEHMQSITVTLKPQLVTGNSSGK
ncbi:MAG: LacI family DNA-binding transcriptional regulator [Alistipes sp.]|nr:LacI family DNA-binding transcriptional regulator [Alistipes sp.]